MNTVFEFAIYRIINYGPGPNVGNGAGATGRFWPEVKSGELVKVSTDEPADAPANDVVVEGCIELLLVSILLLKVELAFWINAD